ncbi:MAG: hypothetical protein A3J28_04080 [Acidobacteria bacterium RIFCSPLOWO2_12_FULL_60_22]|nr:MAG: hypothetical protein A3J28_04080 [Acidobacteria bacterium RIFCSPLOWO2_12_FULL_60_22]
MKRMEKNNNPRELAESRFLVQFGFFKDFANYLNSFERAVELLYAKVSNAEETPYSVALPLLFLMRHSLELGYKYTIVELHYLNEIPYEPEKFKHRLERLHSALRELFNQAATKWSFSKSTLEDFEHHYANTEKCMKEFKQLDDCSMTFRYPIDMKGNPSLSPDDTVNLLALKRSYDSGMLLLDHLADVLQPCYEMLEEFHADTD